MTINLAAIVLMPTLTLTASPHRATADDLGACFMVTSSGKKVSLGSLCGASTAKTDVFRVPIKRRIGKTPVIEVTFNNQKSFEMILDTGASGTLITTGMATALQLQPKGMVQAEIADGSRVRFITSQVKSIAVGGAIANDIEVAIAPKAGIGLLGHDFFGVYDLKILEKEIEFHRR
jgi:predicted aspartyl protease